VTSVDTYLMTLCHRVSTNLESKGFLLMVIENCTYHLFFSSCIMIVTLFNQILIVACFGKSTLLLYVKYVNRIILNVVRDSRVKILDMPRESPVISLLR